MTLKTHKKTNIKYLVTVFLTTGIYYMLPLFVLKHDSLLETLDIYLITRILTMCLATICFLPLSIIGLAGEGNNSYASPFLLFAWLVTAGIICNIKRKRIWSE